MSKKILVVDDDPMIVDYLSDLFRDNGYDTCFAYSAREAFEVLKKETPDLITLDLDMPEKTGLLFYARFRKMKEVNNIPVIVISGLYDHNRAIRKAVAALQKPVDRDELLKIVRDTIGE